MAARVAAVAWRHPAPSRGRAASLRPRDGAADSRQLGPAAKEAAVDAWRAEARARILASRDPKVILEVAEEARKRLAEPDLTLGAQATLHLAISGAYGRLAELRIDRRANGKKAFAEAVTACNLAPTKPAVAESYGRTLASFAELNWAFRKVVTTALGIDLDTEIRRCLVWLAASPDAPLASLLRVTLARDLDDRGEIRRADDNLARLERADSQALAAARAALAADKQRAEATQG